MRRTVRWCGDAARRGHRLPMAARLDRYSWHSLLILSRRSPQPQPRPRLSRFQDSSVTGWFSPVLGRPWASTSPQPAGWLEAFILPRLMYQYSGSAETSFTVYSTYHRVNPEHAAMHSLGCQLRGKPTKSHKNWSWPEKSLHISRWVFVHEIFVPNSVMISQLRFKQTVRPSGEPLKFN